MMNLSTFSITKMDCPSEERMIRMILADLANVKSLEFDIPNRLLKVVHTEAYSQIFQKIDSLKLGASFIESVPLENYKTTTSQDEKERKLLIQVLVINFIFFALEIATGFIANSLGLLADSLDMLADASVYALALFAVGRAVSRKKNIAKIAGYLQLFLAGLGFVELIRKFVGNEPIPDFIIMIIISTLALSANAATLFLLQKSRSKEAHIQASMIFSSNDILINLGVIVAGALVYLTNSKYPDLIVGSLIFIIVGRGVFKILKLSK